MTFTNLANAEGETNPESLEGNTLQANLIMPEATHFLTNNNRKFPPVAIVRPTSTGNSGALASFNAIASSGAANGSAGL